MSEIFKIGIPYLLILIIPGYIYTAVRQFMVGRSVKTIDTGEAVRILIRSVLVNATTTLVLMGLHLVWPSIATSPAWTFLKTMEQPILTGNAAILLGSMGSVAATLFAFFVLPGGYGAFMGAAQLQGWSLQEALRRRYKRLAETSDQAIDQAVFSSLNDCKQTGRQLIVGVRTREGMLYGRFGAQSMLSHSGGYRDLYLEEAWEVNGNGEIVRAASQSSILIKGSVIEALIFFYV